MTPRGLYSTQTFFVNHTRDPVARFSFFRIPSPFAASHLSFSHVTSTSPKIASVTVFPLSLTATFAIVAWFSTTNRSMVFMSCLRWAKVDLDHVSCAARHFLIFNSTESFVSALTSPRYVNVEGSQHLTMLRSGLLAFSCFNKS